MELYSVLTDKMKMLYMDMIASLGQLPEERRGYIFGFEDDLDMDWVRGVAEYIIFEYIKYSFDYDDPEYPIRHFLSGDDSERMLNSRIMQYVLKYKKREIEIKGGCIPENHKYANTDMDSMDKKLKGYRLTEMNYYEHQNIHNLEIIKSIVEHRIISSKKVSNQHFMEMFLQYDELVESLIERSKKSDEDMIFASIALFTLEWHYPIETFYFLACIMEKEGIQNINKDDLCILCGYVEIESYFGGWVTTDSRMTKERLLVLPYLFEKDTGDFDKHTMRELIREIIVLCVHYLEVVSVDGGELYKEWFRKESTVADRASFLRHYNIFSIWKEKEWTRTRIQNMRYLFDIMSYRNG